MKIEDKDEDEDHKIQNFEKESIKIGFQCKFVRHGEMRLVRGSHQFQLVRFVSSEVKNFRAISCKVANPFRYKDLLEQILL